MFFIMRRIAALSRRVKTLRSNIPDHEYSTYQDNAEIKKSRGYSEYRNFDELTKLKLRANNALSANNYTYVASAFNQKIREVDAYHNFYQTHKTLLGSIQSYIPFTYAFQAKQELSQELDNVEFFLRTFESDFYAQKSQERAILNRVNHLLGKKAVNMLRLSLIKTEQIQNFLNHKDTPFDYLGNERIKNSPSYKAFHALAYVINENKNKLIKQAKPTLLSPTKFSSRAQIDNIFPVGSVYRNYIDQTKSWKGYIKSYIPFTQEYKTKQAVAIELKRVKRFIKFTDYEFFKNTIAQLAIKYPKNSPQIANASLSQPSPIVSITNSNPSHIEPINQSPTQDTVTSSDARVLLRTSNDTLKKLDHDRVSPRALEKELEEEKRLAEKFDNEARARAEILILQAAPGNITDGLNNHDILSAGKCEKTDKDFELLVKNEDSVSITPNPGKRPGLATY